jgi:hypothetical protein
MQKAIVVKTSLDPGKEGVFSYEIDPVGSAPPHPLRRLLAAGWEVVHVCPMTNDLESACLVILDRPSGPNRPASKRDVNLVDMNHASPWMGLQTSASAGKTRANSEWDGETIPLGIFRVDPAHAEEPRETS